MQHLLDAAGVARTLDDLATRLAAEFMPETDVVFVGVRSRGVPLAQRLADRLGQRFGQAPPAGVLDITFYRDDLARRNRWPIVRGTAIPFPIDGRRVILVDDVLFTGRTAYAALAALNDLGR